MFKSIAFIVASIGAFAANYSCVGSTLFFWDEPKMPSRLLNK